MTQVAAQQAILAQQKLVATFPSAELEQATVTPQIVQGLEHHIAKEGVGHVMKNADAPFFIAAQSFVNIEGCAAVFCFLCSVPLPHGFKTWLSAFENFRVA